MTITYENLLAFLYREARLLDDKQWEEWLQLYAPMSSSGCRPGTMTAPW